MKSDRPLIGSIVFLAAGLGLVFGYCHGTVALSTAYPLSGSSLQLNITTTGIPAFCGSALIVIGLLLLIVALVAAIIGQFRPAGAVANPLPEDSPE